MYIFVVQISAQTMESHFPRAPPTCHTSLPYSPTLRTPIFGWLFCGNWFVCGRLRPLCISFYFFFVAQFLPQQWYHIPHAPPARHTYPPYCPLFWTPIFGWLLCEPLSIVVHPKAMVYFIYICFHCLNSCPKQWDGFPPHALPPTRLHPNISPITSDNYRLVVGYHYWSAAT